MQIFVLGRVDGKVSTYINVSELSQKIFIKQGNTSNLLTDLENDGIVTKNKNSSTVESILSLRYYFTTILFFNKNIY